MRKCHAETRHLQRPALEGVTTIALDLWGVFSVDTEKIVSIKFSPDGRFLFSGGGRLVDQWNLEERRISNTYQVNGGDVTIVAVSPDSRTLAMGDSKGGVHLFDADSGRETLNIRCHRKAVTALAFSPDNQVLASSSLDKTIQTLNPRMGLKLKTFKGHRRMVHSIAVTPDAGTIVSAGADNSIKVWDMNVGREKKTLEESADKLLTMILSQEGSMVAASVVEVRIDLRRKTREDIRRIKIRNTTTGEEIRTLEGHTKDVTALAFHPDRRFLASGGNDNTIRIWDLQKGDVISVIQQTDDVAGLDFSSDGRWFAALNADRRMTVWKLR